MPDDVGHRRCARMGLYIFSRLVLASWVRTVCAESIACAREVEIGNLSYVRAKSVGGELPVCAGARFVQACLMGAQVWGFETGVQYPSRMTGVLTCAACGMCRCVRARDSCKIACRVFTSGDAGPVYSIPRV